MRDTIAIKCYEHVFIYNTCIDMPVFIQKVLYVSLLLFLQQTNVHYKKMKLHNFANSLS